MDRIRLGLEGEFENFVTMFVGKPMNVSNFVADGRPLGLVDKVEITSVDDERLWLVASSRLRNHVECILMRESTSYEQEGSTLSIYREGQGTQTISFKIDGSSY